MTLMVKKAGVASAIIAVLLASSFNALAASDSATVNITASVVNNTCTSTWDEPVIVDMGRASLNDFKSKGDTPLTKNFELKLKDCGDGATQVHVTAKGDSDTDDKDAFANTATSNAAAGVAVTIFGGPDQGTQMTPDGSTSVTYPIANKAADMKFLAKLEQSSSDADSVKVGDVKSVVTMTVDYE